MPERHNNQGEFGMKPALSALYGLALATLISAPAAMAQETTPAVVFDMGGKFDKSFNEAIDAAAGVKA